MAVAKVAEGNLRLWRDVSWDQDQPGSSDFSRDLELKSYAFFMDFIESQATPSVPFFKIASAPKRHLSPHNPLNKYLEDESFFRSRSHFFHLSNGDEICSIQPHGYRSFIDNLTATIKSSTDDVPSVAGVIQYLASMDINLPDGSPITQASFTAFLRHHSFLFKLGFRDLLVTVAHDIPTVQEVGAFREQVHSGAFLQDLPESPDSDFSDPSSVSTTGSRARESGELHVIVNGTGRVVQQRDSGVGSVELELARDETTADVPSTSSTQVSNIQRVPPGFEEYSTSSTSTIGPASVGPTSSPSPPLASTTSSGPFLISAASTSGPSLFAAASTSGPSLRAAASTSGLSLMPAASTSGRPSLRAVASTSGPSLISAASTSGPSLSAASSSGRPTLRAATSTSGPSLMPAASMSGTSFIASASTSRPSLPLGAGAVRTRNAACQTVKDHTDYRRLLYDILKK